MNKNIPTPLSDTLTRLLIPIVIVVALVAYALAITLGLSQMVRPYLLIPIVVGLLPLAREMIVSLSRRHFGVDVIALLAITSATIAGEYGAALVVLLMLSGGEALEKYALRRARKELTSLLSNAPRIAHIAVGGQIEDVGVDEVHVGQTVIVKPGEIIPVDGKVIEGTSEVDESALTGESVLIEKVPHTRVLSGSINRDAVLTVLVEKKSADSHYAHIIRLVQEAERNKAPFVRLADQYSVWFTAITVILALTAWIVSGDMVRAIAVLVVATPCPLILATPIAFASGISRAAKRGIIIKQGAAIEKIAQARSFLFDKTGTITFGTPKLVRIITYAGVSEDELLHTAASIDQMSAHILARSLLDHARHKKIKDLIVPIDFEEDLGSGVRGVIRGKRYHLGRLTYLATLGITIPPAIQQERDESKQQGIMMVYLSDDTTLLGAFEFADTIRGQVKHLFTQLRQQGLSLTMVTGDKQQVAQHIGQQAGVDQVIAECLPADKVRHVKHQHDVAPPVVMVGDGVNDAPALAAADVGIAMGARGSSAASESGDVVIMVDAVERVGEVYYLAKRVLQIAKESIFVGIGLSIVLMIAATAGYIKPVYGALMQEIIDVMVILNALRVHSSKV